MKLYILIIKKKHIKTAIIMLLLLISIYYTYNYEIIQSLSIFWGSHIGNWITFYFIISTIIQFLNMMLLFILSYSMRIKYGLYLLLTFISKIFIISRAYHIISRNLYQNDTWANVIYRCLILIFILAIIYTAVVFCVKRYFNYSPTSA